MIWNWSVGSIIIIDMTVIMVVTKHHHSYRRESLSMR
jgi:hypothetical protein